MSDESRVAPSRASVEIPAASFALSSLHKSNRAVVPARGAPGHEMTPRARVRGLLNELALVCELPPEEPGVDRLALRKLFQKPLSVVTRNG